MPPEIIYGIEIYITNDFQNNIKCLRIRYINDTSVSEKLPYESIKFIEDYSNIVESIKNKNNISIYRDNNIIVGKLIQNDKKDFFGNNKEITTRSTSIYGVLENLDKELEYQKECIPKILRKVIGGRKYEQRFNTSNNGSRNGESLWRLETD